MTAVNINCVTGGDITSERGTRLTHRHHRETSLDDKVNYLFHYMYKFSANETISDRAYLQKIHLNIRGRPGSKFYSIIHVFIPSFKS